MFDRAGLLAQLAEGAPVIRVVIAEVKGSSPREVGAAMLVWRDAQGALRQSGTIGGGALEHLATQAAQDMLTTGAMRRFDRYPLGPAIGQCCGGAVALLSERYADGVTLPETVMARPATGDAPMPLAVKRLLVAQRGQGVMPQAQLLQGWFIEPVARPSRQLWVWGAGHVGRALVSVLAPLPEVAITWVDTGIERFPETIPAGVTMLPAADPALVVAYAPQGAEHIVLTYSHALDLELCHRIMTHGFAALGVIGSATKAARFRARLHDLGHLPVEIQRIACPIGDRSLGKHPQAIALGVATAFLKRADAPENRQEKAG
ncbi:xanthine dehydrogenase accessory protein XdhC [Gemmobacter serpentinus]|uniref:xanthine dehydrogenase accessory protein XdhC n=1 Tax=Gemmobacter serpentinus TaxID=2652247 RepID=UPI00124D1D14|nr:xanthine dehydrogenase accessory protein XdhC [Gemmobacter serpentinus]